MTDRDQEIAETARLARRAVELSKDDIACALYSRIAISGGCCKNGTASLCKSFMYTPF